MYLRASEFFNSKYFKSNAGADHIHDRIHGPNLVKMNCLDVDPMNLCLCLCESPKNAHRPFFYGIG